MLGDCPVMEFFDLRYNTKLADGGNFEIGNRADSQCGETAIVSRTSCLIHGRKLGSRSKIRISKLRWVWGWRGGCADGCVDWIGRLASTLWPIELFGWSHLKLWSWLRTTEGRGSAVCKEALSGESTSWEKHILLPILISTVLMLKVTYSTLSSNGLQLFFGCRIEALDNSSRHPTSHENDVFCPHITVVRNFPPLKVANLKSLNTYISTPWLGYCAFNSCDNYGHINHTENDCRFLRST